MISQLFLKVTQGYFLFSVRRLNTKKPKMREELKKKIKKNIIQLKRDMDARDLTDYFIQEDILDFNDVEKINGYNPNTSDSRNTCFFGLILDRSDEAYNVFLMALRENSLEYLADMVENTQVVAQPSSGN